MKPAKVLVIEDNPPLRRMVAVTLRTAGYEVVEAGDGREALAKASAELPALILQDLMLPDVEASALLAQLRSLPGGEQVPVIAVSGSRDKLDSFIARKQSFTDSLFKPVESAQLLATVGRYAAAAESESQLGAGRRLVLADDDPVQRKLARLRLERLGFKVRIAGDGAEALLCARATPPDVIVSDVLMPALDGFELCRAVREDPALREVPVILMSSAYIDASDRALAMRAGASAFLERGPDLAELIATLTECLHGHSGALAPTLNFDAEHAARVRAQLDQQAAENRELREHVARGSVDLSVLAGISSVVTRAHGSAEVLQEALSRCIEVGGLSASIVMLRDRDGNLTETAQAGAFSCIAALRQRLHRSPESELLAGGLFEPPSERNQGPAVSMALATAGETLGVLSMSWGEGEVSEPRIAFARAIGGQLSEAIALQRAFDELDCSREETISRLALAAESRDDCTARHTERVSAYATLLAERFGLDRSQTELIRLASVMHDVGKIGVSDTILLKPGPLTRDEFETMKLHTTIGHRILSGSDVELLEVAATIALTHHERYDGTGYPRGLAGSEIPIEGRTVAVADVFDALTSDRVYRPAMTIEAAIETMLSERGGLFDPELLDILLRSLDDVLALRAGHAAGRGMAA